MTDFSVIFVTVGNENEASKIAQVLVEERWVACVNIVPRIRSVYRWKGEVCSDEEFLLVMKTRSSLFTALQNRILELHSYEVPEIIAVPLTQGLPDYLHWVEENTRS
ncbi:divalent-cation tolerance protein CutA [Desulforhabdus amnigena]|jgi:periplasmic divalent cation tolerance protein|uniref:Divalent-cation tolerance protein CutA n=1 Tax=Desulforhabdus amnigena TaxID=40218 RepID=A0A9W6L9D1_9BACT|nr:divalent-cation tolerance protein CutA [Desulforhabdus amnigena]NLJ27125.1 divalent-cation tolerance protein CutA [Deltaproteobacteria bacterium]GLI36402.1 divalent-cation tolerance protein CutA [Desulforhabdus amnigena]